MKTALLIVCGVTLTLSCTSSGGGDTGTPEPFLLTHNPIETPVSVLEGSGEEACAIYQEQTCEAGVLRECSTYNAATQAFVTPDPLTHRALMYERWHDLYFTPDGQATKRMFNQSVPPDATEEEWSAVGVFDNYSSLPDAMIWTGVGLLSYMLRYSITGTEVDYQRIEKKTRELLTMFDMTGIEGFAPRGYYYIVDDAAPYTTEHAVLHESLVDSLGGEWKRNPAGDLNNAPDIAELYRTGFVDDTGTRWEGETVWFGSPTIDMYSGVTASLPAAWGLLRDEDLKARIARHMSCYLKRLKRYEIINLQDSDDGVAMIETFLEGGNAQFDEGDPDLTQLDRIVFYVLEQPNVLNEDTFDRSCPDTVALEPTRLLDATSNTFFEEMLALVFDLDGKRNHSARGVDHLYVPNVRGYDAVHLMYLASLVHHMTGEDQYRSFLEDELIGNLNTLEVIKTWAAVIPNKWCRKWYTEHISFPPMWAFAMLLQDSPFRDQILEVIYEEVWLKDASELLNAKFGLLYGGLVPEGVGTGQAEAIETSAQLLRDFGGNGGFIDSPRRNYPLNSEDVIAALPAGITAACPTQEQKDQCEAGSVLFGIPIPGDRISETCTGSTDQCVMPDGACVERRASSALPPMMREQWGYQWQGDPYALGSNQNGLTQSIGVDMFEPYWTARFYHAIPEAEDVVLAWEDMGSCP